MFLYFYFQKNLNLIFIDETSFTKKLLDFKFQLILSLNRNNWDRYKTSNTIISNRGREFKGITLGTSLNITN